MIREREDIESDFREKLLQYKRRDLSEMVEVSCDHCAFVAMQQGVSHAFTHPKWRCCP